MFFNADKTFLRISKRLLNFYKTLFKLQMNLLYFLDGCKLSKIFAVFQASPAIKKARPTNVGRAFKFTLASD